MGKDIITITRSDERYPERLRELPGMPDTLYLRGKLPPPGPVCAVVGARMCSSYGRSQAYAFGRFLARHGIAVISGMARGIDGYAQMGALDAGGYSLAVLGCGADICYPRANSGLYQILLQKGGLLSEYPPGTEAAPYHFPERNRIISAMSDAVVIVEARKRSGSLITADLAMDMGKSVYAFPGRIEDLLSEGCNHLIAQGAGIVESFATLLEEFGIPEKQESSPPGTDRSAGKGTEITEEGTDTASFFPQDPRKSRVLDVLGGDPVSADTAAERSGLPVDIVRGALILLTLSGEVCEVGAGLFRKR